MDPNIFNIYNIIECLRFRSPFFVEVRSKIDSNGWTVITRLMVLGVRVHRIDVIVGEVHDDHLGVSSFRPGGNISPHMLRGDFAIVGNKVVFEAGLVIVVSFPYHSFHFGMSVAIMPVIIIVNSELGLSIFNNSIGIVDTRPNTQVN